MNIDWLKEGAKAADDASIYPGRRVRVVVRQDGLHVEGQDWERSYTFAFAWVELDRAKINPIPLGVEIVTNKLGKAKELDAGGIEVGTGRQVPPAGTAERLALDAEID
jgi:hypothetical protein